MMYYLPRLLQRPYKRNLDIIESINSVQSSWKAVSYPEHEMYTLQELHYRAGGPASRIPMWVFARISQTILWSLAAVMEITKTICVHK